MTLAKVTAERVPTGNYQTEATCSNRSTPHTVYKKNGDTNSDYKCPHEKCGHSVN